MSETQPLRAGATVVYVRKGKITKGTVVKIVTTERTHGVTKFITIQPEGGRHWDRSLLRNADRLLVLVTP